MIFNFLPKPPVQKHLQCIISKIFIFVVLYGCPFILKAQDNEKSKLDFGGYVSLVQSAMFDSLQGNWTTGNLVHNRLNFKYYASKTITGSLEVRNRLFFGESVKNNPISKQTYSFDNGLADLSMNVFEGNSYVFNIAVDRFWLAFEKNKWRVTLGRQRINWGQTWVWNPNDIFNAYSFFDFDYSERPGSDALRIQYYNSEVSVTECAIKMNHDKKVTAAGYYKFNKWGYDFQVLGGVLNEADYVIGSGWAGAIKQLALRGEMSYFKPIKNFADTTDLFMASVAFDYSFSNSLVLMAEFLYNSSVSIDFSNFMTVYNAPLSVKNLSFVKYNVLLQASYPVTPLFNVSLAGMYLPPVRGYYAGPSINYSASDNIELALFLQSFGGKMKNEVGETLKIQFNMLFLRVKLSY